MARHEVEPAGGVVADFRHFMLEANVLQLRRGPAAVAVVFTAREVEVLADEVREDLALLLAVVQVAVPAGGIGQRHQIGQEGVLQRRVLDQHAGVPVERFIPFEKQAAVVLQRLGQAGKAQVERPQADRDEIEGRFVRVHRLVFPGRRTAAAAHVRRSHLRMCRAHEKNRWTANACGAFAWPRLAHGIWLLVGWCLRGRRAKRARI
jgi:ATP/maltotriose-dependent transcriptional regulator MalT